MVSEFHLLYLPIVRSAEYKPGSTFELLRDRRSVWEE